MNIMMVSNYVALGLCCKGIGLHLFQLLCTPPVGVTMYIMEAVNI